MSRRQQPTRDQLLKVAALADALDREPAAKWTDSTADDEGVMHMPHLQYGPVVQHMIEMAYDIGLVAPFDWSSWQGEAERLIENPAALERADLDTLQKLLTLHIRKDRFCEGHLEAMRECGHLVAILRRIGEIASGAGPGVAK